MKFFFIIALIFHFFYSSGCYAVYLLSKENKALEFEEWVSTKRTVHQQAWQEGRAQRDLALDGITTLFVPDSLMQAFTLDKLHKVLRNNVQKELGNINIDDGYIDFEEVPFKFIHSEYEANKKNKKTNEKVTKVFEEKQKSIINQYFPRRGLDEGFINILNQTPPSPSSDSDDDNLEEESWTPPTLEDAIKYFLNIEFSANKYNTPRLKAQCTLEKIFFETYQEMIKNGSWSDILDSFYPPINPKKKSHHFINLSNVALTEDGFMRRFLDDRENLLTTIMFEVDCENNNQIGLLRGQGTRDTRITTDERHAPTTEPVSLSFGRGYYSGIFRDAHASMAYRSSKHKYFLGLAASKQIFTELMVIPPLSWYQNLSLGGELWHPRTTVAISTPLGERTEELTIQGVNLLLPIDKLGVLVKESDTQAHFQNVEYMLENSVRLKENSDL